MEKYEKFEAIVKEVKQIEFDRVSFTKPGKQGSLVSLMLPDGSIHDAFLPVPSDIENKSHVYVCLPKITSMESPSGSGDFVDFENTREYYTKTSQWTPSKLEIIANEKVSKTIENPHAVVNPFPHYGIVNKESGFILDDPALDDPDMYENLPRW